MQAFTFSVWLQSFFFYVGSWYSILAVLYTYASVYDEYTEVLSEYILPELPLMFSLFYLGLLINQ